MLLTENEFIEMHDVYPHPDSLVYQALVMVAFLQGGQLVFNDMDDCQPCGDEKCSQSSSFMQNPRHLRKISGLRLALYKQLL